MGDFIVGVHKDDVFAGRVLKCKAFAFFHVLAIVVNDDGAVFFCDVACAVGRMRVGQQNFIAVAWIRLAGDGREDIVQQRLHVERRHDEADARQIFRTGLHKVSVAEGAGKFKSALRGRADFMRTHRDEPKQKQYAERDGRRHGHNPQQVRRRFAHAQQSNPVGDAKSAIEH